MQQVPTKTYYFGQNSMEIPTRYSVGKVVGRGAYGLVCSAVDTRTGDRVAIKKIGKVFEDLVDAKRILRELTLLAFIKHPYLLYLKDVFRPVPDPDTFSDIYLVTEFMDTDLAAVLKCRVALLEGHCQYFMYQLASGLQYLHSAGILHRDLKPANLLTNGECELKICDFGLARARGPLMTDYVVTRWYRPPELLLVCDGYHAAIDMWAVGCLAYEMLTRKPLFPGKDYIHQITLIVDTLGTPNLQNDLKLVKSQEAKAFVKTMPHRERIPLDVLMPKASSEVKDFITGLLKFDPDARMTATEALRHPWLACIGEDESAPPGNGGEAFSSMLEGSGGDGPSSSTRQPSNTTTLSPVTNNGSGSGSVLGGGPPNAAPGLFRFDHEGDLDEATLRRLYWNEISKFHESARAI